MSVVIETTLGDITVDLFLAERPRACLNFLKLCKLKYYNYNLFHTISRGFMAQTGDPTGSRKGGESLYGVLDGPEKRYFEGENEPRIKHTKMGLISFVGDDERMIGSQFFITLGEDLTYLDQKHCVFGEVVEGIDILEIINEVICDTDDRPYQDVRITHTVIIDDPFPDPKRLRAPSRSPSPSAERLQGGRIAPDEDIDETEGKSAGEIAENQAEREAKARATILEMVGDLPDAEMAPPENVLFVCKLNPITTDDDLEIIFNRFGKIVSCEVIRDKKTGDSLQYAFIEFDDRKSCEDAYFKMDNILIDDRRIHVDFSQSVSKVKWNGKGRGVTHFDEKGRKTTQSSKDIGKGNYKVKNDRNERSRSKSPEENKNTSTTNREKSFHNENNYKQTSKSSQSSKKDEKDRLQSPYKEYNKENNSKGKNSRNYRNQSYSRSRSRSPRRRIDNSRRRERFPSPRKNRNYRSRSRSPRRTDDRWGRLSNSERYNIRREDLSRRRYEESRRRNRSRTPDRIRDRHDKNSSSSSRYAEKDQRTDKYSDNNNSRQKDTQKHADNNKTNDKNQKSIDHSKKEKIQKISKYKSSENDSINKKSKSKSSDSEKEESRKNPKKKKDTNEKNKNKRKIKRKESTESSDSDSDSESDSSESEAEKSKSKHKKKKRDSSDSSSDEKFKKKKKRKQSTETESESESESESSDSSESESSESSESEGEKKKKRKHRKKTKTSSDSDSSEEERKKRKKKKK